MCNQNDITLVGVMKAQSPTRADCEIGDFKRIANSTLVSPFAII
jgi:hypothetical protein